MTSPDPRDPFAPSYGFIYEPLYSLWKLLKCAVIIETPKNKNVTTILDIPWLIPFIQPIGSRLCIPSIQMLPDLCPIITNYIVPS